MIPALIYATIFYFLGKAVAKNYNIGVPFRVVISIFAFVITFVLNLIIIVAITKEDPSPPVGVFTWFSAVAFFIASAPLKATDSKSVNDNLSVDEKQNVFFNEEKQKFAVESKVKGERNDLIGRDNNIEPTLLNYYDILCISRECDDVTIKSAYKYLSMTYHSDFFKGDAVYALHRIDEINKAFAVLGDKNSRSNYDVSRQNGRPTQVDEIFERNDLTYESFFGMVENEWKVAVAYYPESESMRVKLLQINTDLGFIFQVVLLSTKDFGNSLELFSKLKLGFMTSKFGDDLKVHSLVSTAIDSGNKRFIFELNKAISVVGQADTLRVLYILISKFEDFCKEYYSIHGFSMLISQYKSLGLSPGRYKSGKHIFGVSSDYTVYLEVPGFFGSNSSIYESVEKMIDSKALTEDEVRRALRI